MKNKELAVYDFKEMTQNSWTYAKMTDKEKENWEMLLTHTRVSTCLKGNYDSRWGILQAIYHTYLIGIGYTDFNWRNDCGGDK